MEIIDKSKVGKQERFYRESNEMLEDLVYQKEEMIARKAKPSQAQLAYLDAFRSALFNKEGKSRNKDFAVVASFDVSVNVEMTNKYGPAWYDKPGVLEEFLRQNPQYRIGQPMDGLRGLGKITVDNIDKPEQTGQMAQILLPKEEVTNAEV
jgi:hypothetical protein